VKIFLNYQPANKTIYGFNNRRVFKIYLASKPPTFTILTRDFGGPELKLASMNTAGMSIDSKNNFLSFWTLSGGNPQFYGVSHNVETGKTNVSKVGKEFYNCQNLFWDPTRLIMKAFFFPLEGKMEFALLNLDDFSNFTLLHRYNDTYSRLFAFDYDPDLDILFAKLQAGEWHARSRKYNYATLNPVTGNITNSIRASKQKYGGGIWHYEGPKLGDFLAFFRNSNITSNVLSF